MEFRNLTTFLKVAELKNISKAAQKLGYSQSAVTLQIQQLEKELQTRLFERVGKGVVLTEQGQEFLFYVNEIMSTTNQAIQSVQNHGRKKDPQEMTGILRIGSVESISTALLPEIVLEFHRRYPKVEITISTQGRDILIEQIRDNSLDLFLTLDQKAEYSGLVRETLREEEIIFIMPGAGKTEQGPIDADALCRETFVLTERGESYRFELERAMAKRGLSVRAQLEIGNTETIVHMVEAGFGISFLPHFSAQKALETGKVCQMETDLPVLTMWLQLYYHKNKWISPQMGAFLSVVREYFHAL